MIEIKELTKKFDGHWVLKGVNLTIPTGKMTCIIGRSGEGKSVLLKSIIGLIQPTTGSIVINKKEITRLSERELRKLLSSCGYVFQFSALLDSLTIFENVGLALLEKGKPESEVLPIVKEKLAMVHLSPVLLDKYPSDLSGGMKKELVLPVL